MDTQRLQKRLQSFADARDWEQYHSPKNLASALCVEAGELLELFLWMVGEESRLVAGDPDLKGRAREEIADIQIYLLRLADKLDIDLEAAVEDKIERNAEKYPPEEVRDRDPWKED